MAGRAVPMRAQIVTAGALGVLAAAVLLTGCAAAARQHSSPPAAARQHSSAPAAARDCTSAQLSARFAGGGLATGSDFGVIEIWNPTAEPCQLHGSVTFAARYADGSLDGKATNNRPITVAPVALPNNMPAPRDGQDLSGYLFATLMGPERDDASQPNALCRQQDKRAPATLQLIIGSVQLSVPNQDAGSVQVTAVYGCHGTVLLETVEPPTGNPRGR